MAEERRGPEINSHDKEKALGTILFIWQREAGPDVFTATFAKRLKGFLRGWAVFHVLGGQTAPVLNKSFCLKTTWLTHFRIVLPIQPNVFAIWLSTGKLPYQLTLLALIAIVTSPRGQGLQVSSSTKWDLDRLRDGHLFGSRRTHTARVLSLGGYVRVDGMCLCVRACGGMWMSGPMYVRVCVGVAKGCACV